MGVSGLYSFIHDNASFLLSDTFELRQTTVVIDGLNLVYHLYRANNLSLLYGGEYPKYAVAVYDFFTRLKRNHVKSIVVLDGYSDPTGIKEKTVTRRMADKLSAIHTSNPPLLEQVLVDVCRKEYPRDVTVYRCPGEADRVIADLANRHGCPVISNDSDFFVFDIPGYVLLNSIDCNSGGEDGDISCQHYSRRNWLRRFPQLQLDLLPLLALLKGNDFIQDGTFDDAIRVLLPSTKCAASNSNLVATGHAAKLLKGIICWLNEKSLEGKSKVEIVDIIMDQTRGRKSAGVRCKAMACLDMYTVASVLASDDTALVDKNFPDSVDARLRLAYSDLSLPPALLQVLCEKRVRISVCIEDLSQPPAHLVAADLRQLAYSLTFVGRSVSITEVGRNANGDVGRRLVQTDATLRPPDAEDAADWLAQHLRLPVDWIRQLPSDDRFFCCCTAYWLQRRDVRVSEALFRSVCCTYMRLSRCASTTPSLRDVKLLVVTTNNTRSAGANKRKRKTGTGGGGATDDERRLVHALTQLQFVLVAMTALNAVLHMVDGGRREAFFVIPPPQKLYSGELIYNLADSKCAFNDILCDQKEMELFAAFLRTFDVFTHKIRWCC